MPPLNVRVPLSIRKITGYKTAERAAATRICLEDEE